MTDYRLFLALAVLGLGACASQGNGSSSASAGNESAARTTETQSAEAGKTAENEPEVICRRERQTGSNRPRRVCYPASNMTSGDGAL